MNKVPHKKTYGNWKTQSLKENIIGKKRNEKWQEIRDQIRGNWWAECHMV